MVTILFLFHFDTIYSCLFLILYVSAVAVTQLVWDDFFGVS